MSEPITIEIEAIEPETLLDHPSSVFIRRTDKAAYHGWYVQIHGNPVDVYAFIAEHWGEDQAGFIREQPAAYRVIDGTVRDRPLEQERA